MTTPLLPNEVINAAQRSILCWLASVAPDGQPNVSPKEIYAIFDDTHIVIANIASPRSASNIMHSNKVASVSWMYSFKRASRYSAWQKTLTRVTQTSRRGPRRSFKRQGHASLFKASLW
jgi:hypothetical protein